jgi:hypothetical protein
MPATEDCFTATGRNAALRVPSTLDRRSHNERFSNISEDIERLERFGMPDLYRRQSCTDRVAFDRWLKANAVVASIFSAALVVMAFAGARPAGRVEEAAGRNMSGLQRESPVAQPTLWDKVQGKVRDARERHKRSSQ